MGQKMFNITAPERFHYYFRCVGIAHFRYSSCRPFGGVARGNVLVILLLRERGHPAPLGPLADGALRVEPFRPEVRAGRSGIVKGFGCRPGASDRSSIGGRRRKASEERTRGKPVSSW